MARACCRAPNPRWDRNQAGARHPQVAQLVSAGLLLALLHDGQVPSSATPTTAGPGASLPSPTSVQGLARLRGHLCCGGLRLGLQCWQVRGFEGGAGVLAEGGVASAGGCRTSRGSRRPRAWPRGGSRSGPRVAGRRARARGWRPASGQRVSKQSATQPVLANAPCRHGSRSSASLLCSSPRSLWWITPGT